ncbi:MAG: flagellar hook-basal body complex protein FliE [Actinobacteria bacterium]|nr:flagellar hook-basal body complex protein FliE [Actinomycetota bacterium]
MAGIGPIGNIGNVGGVAASAGPSATRAQAPGGFGEAVLKGLDSVAGLERTADNLVANMAAGGNVQISDVMAATSKANLGMAIVNEIRSRGLEAYQSIINIQV